MLEDLKKEINNIDDIETMRNICQRFSDKYNCGINFDSVSDDDIISSFNQIKGILSCLK